MENFTVFTRVFGSFLTIEDYREARKMKPFKYCVHAIFHLQSCDKINHTKKSFSEKIKIQKKN